MTGIVTASMIPTIIAGSDMRATPPALRMSAGTRSSAMTATAPASSAIFAWSAVTTSMMTPPLSIWARPFLVAQVEVSTVMWAVVPQVGVRSARRPVLAPGSSPVRVGHGLARGQDYVMRADSAQEPARIGARCALWTAMDRWSSSRSRGSGASGCFSDCRSRAKPPDTAPDERIVPAMHGCTSRGDLVASSAGSCSLWSTPAPGRWFARALSPVAAAGPALRATPSGAWPTNHSWTNTHDAGWATDHAH